MTTPPKSYREIPLTRGLMAIVDIADYGWLSQWKWFAQSVIVRGKQYFYAARSIRVGGSRSIVLMHRLILGLDKGDKREGDHENRNKLDNRRVNLRIASRAENCWNTSVKSSNTSGFKGVSWDKARTKWQAHITIKGKSTSLGRFDSAEKAHAAYCQAALRLFGEFACTH